MGWVGRRLKRGWFVTEFILLLLRYDRQLIEDVFWTSLWILGWNNVTEIWALTFGFGVD
jgi:hypothetical protein